MIQKKFFNKKNKNTKRRLYIFLKFILGIATYL